MVLFARWSLVSVLVSLRSRASTFESNIDFPSSVPCHLFTWIHYEVTPHLVALSLRPDGVP